MTCDISLPAISNSFSSQCVKLEDSGKNLSKPFSIFLTDANCESLRFKNLNPIKTKPNKIISSLLPLQTTLDGIIDDCNTAIKLFDQEKRHKSSTTKYKQSTSFSRDISRYRRSIKENHNRKEIIDSKPQTNISLSSIKSLIGEIKNNIM